MTGVGMSVPDRRVTNTELAERLGVEAAWIEKRTGTRERPWAEPGERLADHAAAAGTAALERAGVRAADLELVIVATTTADEMTPNAAPLVAGMIGARHAAAFDLGAACTGWLAALGVACGQIESGRVRHALVIGADFLSRFLDLADRDTSVLFADGAGAAVVGPGAAGNGIGPVVLHADDAGAPLIRLERGAAIRMDGRETFRAAVNALVAVSHEALSAAGLTLDDIDLFVPHQANSRIIRAVGERLGFEAGRVADYVARFANASTATLPVALATAEAEGRLGPGARVLLAAFGGGFTWGATTLRWAPSGRPPVITPG